MLNAAAGTSPTRAQLDALPTDPAALRATLLAQVKQQDAQAQQYMEQQLKKAKKGTAFPVATDPLSDNDLVFEQATDLLWEPHLRP